MSSYDFVRLRPFGHTPSARGPEERPGLTTIPALLFVSVHHWVRTVSGSPRMDVLLGVRGTRKINRPS